MGFIYTELSDQMNPTYNTYSIVPLENGEPSLTKGNELVGFIYTELSDQMNPTYNTYSIVPLENGEPSLTKGNGKSKVAMLEKVN